MAASGPSLAFQLLHGAPASSFSPRLGLLTLSRAHASGSSSIETPTPNFLTMTSRGMIPHLSRDHIRQTEAIGMVHVPFESFLDHQPPVPTLQTGPNPLHIFLGFSPERHIVSMSMRESGDERETPPNGNDYIVAWCIRGARRITSTAYRSYVEAVEPDIVFALPDIPASAPAYSQKRLTRSIERTMRWLTDILLPSPLASTTSSTAESDPVPPWNIFAHLFGGTNGFARRAFSNALLEPLEDKDAVRLPHLKNLDGGVSGYVMDLSPLRPGLEMQLSVPPDSPSSDAEVQTKRDPLAALLCASLTPLSPLKPRIALSPTSPHEILRLVHQSGIDLFDSKWAQQAADWGVALDFVFPAPASTAKGPNGELAGGERKKQQIGVNIYEEKYVMDFGTLSETTTTPNGSTRCPCIACSPGSSPSPSGPIIHSASDEPMSIITETPPALTRAYVHHLLQTHEMAAHSLLASHNLTVLSSFFASIRNVLSTPEVGFAGEIERFGLAYDEGLDVMKEARGMWEEVDLSRGKGRLKRLAGVQEGGEGGASQQG